MICVLSQMHVTKFKSGYIEVKYIFAHSKHIIGPSEHGTSICLIPYKNKYWRGTKSGELANRHAIAKFKSRQYFFYGVSIVTLVAFE